MIQKIVIFSDGMKKFFLVVVVALSATAGCFSQTAKLEKANWFVNIHTSKIVRFLKLNSSQFDGVNIAMNYFSEKMRDAINGQDEKSVKYLNEAVFGHLKLMKDALSDIQYRNYLRLLNTELENKSLTQYIKK